jgi:probable HAF family extracellular repeat protein
MNNRTRIPILLLLGVFIFFCTASNSDANKIRYHYIDLGTLGGQESWATGINNWGQVVGVSETKNRNEYRAFLWTHKKMKDLGILDGDFSSGAWTINDRGQVVGFSLNSAYERRPVLWDHSGLHELETLGGTYSDAFGINRHGEIAGWATLPDETDEIVHAVSWNKRGITDMNPFQSDLSVASSINTKGEMVGAYLTSEGLLRAVLWGKQGVRELGTLGGDESEAYWINDKGEAVGWCELPGGGWHACLWTPHGDTVDLGALDGLYSEAYSINDHGKVVGSVFLDKTLETSRAFIWTRKGGMQDLNTLVDLPDGVLVAHANSINDFGWIAGTTDSGSACLLIPYKSGKEMKALRDSFKR